MKRDYRTPIGDVRKQKRYPSKYQQLKQHPKYQYTSYKKAAKSRNLEFDLTFEQFGEFWRLPCYYCGSEILNIGIDRVDNSKGYIEGNLVPCCTWCNRMKSNYASEDFIERCKTIAVRF